jgi:hypothetical protein
MTVQRQHARGLPRYNEQQGPWSPLAQIVSIRVNILSLHLRVTVGLTPTCATKTIGNHDSLSATLGAGVLVVNPWVCHFKYSCQSTPRPTTPNRAIRACHSAPYPTIPRHTKPCRSAPAIPGRAIPRHTKPDHAPPSRSVPALPFHSMPHRTMPVQA